MIEILSAFICTQLLENLLKLGLVFSGEHMINEGIDE